MQSANDKIKKASNKTRLNLRVREEQRNKLEEMAVIEERSVANLIEVMADERWERLVEQQRITLRFDQVGSHITNASHGITRAYVRLGPT